MGPLGASQEMEGRQAIESVGRFYPCLTYVVGSWCVCGTLHCVRRSAASVAALYALQPDEQWVQLPASVKFVLSCFRVNVLVFGSCAPVACGPCLSFCLR